MSDQTTRRRGRPPNKPPLRQLLDAINEGVFDDYLGEIEKSLDARRGFLRDGVLKRVKEVFGEDATVVTPDDSPLKRLFKKTEEEESEPEPRKNPFVEKEKAKAEPQPEPEEAPPPADALANIEAINRGEQMPLHMRGAIIGGLSSSDIGD